MAKISNTQAAFSHAQAYAHEELFKHFKGDRSVLDGVRGCKTIKELLSLVVGEHKDISECLQDCGLKEFYKAMRKVCKVLEKEGGYTEYGGTEDRGWFRVWGSIVLNSGYFCIWDLGRDVSMANTLYESGAISEDQIKTYRVKVTLKMAGNDQFMTNGRPDTTKIEAHWKPEWINKAIDLPLLCALRMATI